MYSAYLKVAPFGHGQHSVPILTLVGKSSKTQDDADNLQESVTHSDGVVEQPTQFAVVLITHMDAPLVQ